MRTTILALLGVAVMATATIQLASARERHHVRKAERAPASNSLSTRSSNADLLPAPWGGEPDWHRYPGH
jgi:hypothetical protein